MKKGETLTLKAVVTPEKATNKGIKWSSSNTKIAAVDKNGKVTVKKAGKVTITVKAAATSQYQAAGKTITITVTKKAVKKAAK